MIYKNFCNGGHDLQKFSGTEGRDRNGGPVVISLFSATEVVIYKNFLPPEVVTATGVRS